MDSKVKGETAIVDGWRASENKGFFVGEIFFRGMTSAPSYLRKGSGWEYQSKYPGPGAKEL
jgi:hypothetical protein